MSWFRPIFVLCLGLGISYLPCFGGSARAEEDAAAEEAPEASCDAEDEGALEAETDIAFFSAYVFRGQVCNDEMVMQNYLNVAKAGFYMSAWSNFNMTDRVTEDPAFSEADFYIGYDRAFGPINVDVGEAEYTYPTTVSEDDEGNTIPADGSRELYVGVYAEDWIVSPSIYLYYDIAEADGVYVTAAVEKEIPIVEERFSVTPACSIGWASSGYNGYYFGRRVNEMNEGVVSLSANYSFTESVVLSGLLGYSWLWDDTIREGAKEIYWEDDTLYAGLTLFWYL